MDMMIEEQPPHDGPVYYYASCCWPGGRRTGAYFWGGILVAVGSISLLDALNFLPAVWVSALWPLLIVGSGLALFTWAIQQRG